LNHEAQKVHFIPLGDYWSHWAQKVHFIPLGDWLNHEAQKVHFVPLSDYWRSGAQKVHFIPLSDYWRSGAQKVHFIPLSDYWRSGAQKVHFIPLSDYWRTARSLLSASGGLLAPTWSPTKARETNEEFLDAWKVLAWSLKSGFVTFGPLGRCQGLFTEARIASRIPKTR
jgi:hypothetical protein